MRFRYALLYHYRAIPQSPPFVAVVGGLAVVAVVAVAAAALRVLTYTSRGLQNCFVLLFENCGEVIHNGPLPDRVKDYPLLGIQFRTFQWELLLKPLD
jgi:hypothetical protein